MIKNLCALTVFVLATTLWFGYRTTKQGTLYLKNAPGEVTIHREAENGIAHIRSESL